MDYGPSEKPTTNVFDVSTALAQLGLGQYEERLQENGFEDWETMTAITESDMDDMNFKLGHRRKLQRAIRESSDATQSHKVHEGGELSLPFERPPTAGHHLEGMPQSSQHAARATRQYRRHPRPDPNAPRKPKTAYVLFGEHVRQDSALGNASFTEIAKETGKRWRRLPLEERMVIWDLPAVNALQEFRKEFEHYKQTESYQSYQTYLEGFRQQWHTPEPTLHTASDTRFSFTHSPVTVPASQEGPEAISEGRMETDDLDSEPGAQDMALPVDGDMQEVYNISKALGINVHLARVAAFPPEDMTTKAVEAFLHGTGSLLHLWNPDEALDLVRSVYHPQNDSKPVYATEVFAMSAVGSYCDAEVHETLAREKFLNFFVYMLSSSSEVCILRRMRLLTCLAVCRFTNSVESARRLMCKSPVRVRVQTLVANSQKYQPSVWEGRRSRLPRRKPILPKKNPSTGGVCTAASCF
jgi:hypothetical protein